MQRALLLFFASVFAGIGVSAVLQMTGWLSQHKWAVWASFSASAVCILLIFYDWSRRRLIIHRALWGIGPKIWDYEDVTKTVRVQLKNNSIAMRADDHVLGDPYPGKAKHLRVMYSLGRTKRKQITISHNDWLRLGTSSKWPSTYGPATALYFAR